MYICISVSAPETPAKGASSVLAQTYPNLRIFFQHVCISCLSSLNHAIPRHCQYLKHQHDIPDFPIMDRRHNTTNDVSTAKYSHIISSDEQGQFRHSNEKGGLTMVHARLSEETDSTLLDQVDLSEDDDDLRESGDSHGNGSRRRRMRLGPVWLWALHTGLFLMSLMFFVLGATMGPSTRTFVQQFSAYCESSPSSQCSLQIRTLYKSIPCILPRR